MSRQRILGIFALFACMLLAWPSLAQQSRELWVARHDGPISLNDSPAAIAVDSTGNAYVTGLVCTATELFYGCTEYDWETVKYDTNGNALWTARFAGELSGPSAIAVDASSNVYVTGRICTAPICECMTCFCSYSDYATIKYDPHGAQLWVALYNEGQFGTDGAAAIAVDQSGNVYVTGGSYGPDFLPHYATLKYDTNGNTIWVARYNGPGNGSDYAGAIGVDSFGNVYITGESTGVNASLDYATIKYDSAGNQIWVARYDGPSSGDDVAVALAIGASGNVYVTGFSAGTGTSDDYATIKYDSMGNQLWLARYDGPAHGMDRATAIALDSNENVLVTGFSFGVSTSFDYATLKYDPNGNQMWVARYDGPAHGADQAAAIAVDTFGRVNVTGQSMGIGTGSDYATIQYSPQGTTNWVDRYDGPSHSDDIAVAVAVDSSGNAYVTGSSSAPVTNFDWATLELSAAPPPDRDFNGDGRSDILWRNTNAGGVVEWLMNATSVIGSGSPGGAASPWTIAGAGDLNGDGTSDIVWYNASSGAVVVWLMNGTTVIGTGSPGGAASPWTIAGVGDFNGDGKSDILWYNTSSGTVVEWLMNGTSIIGTGSPGGAASPWTIAGIGDFNADGKSDILWRNTSSGTVVEWLMNGTSVSSSGSPGGATTDWVIAKVGDYNGDGKSDILWRNSTSGALVEWLLNGGTVISTGSPGGATLDWQIQ
jgi:hypothetical protein